MVSFTNNIIMLLVNDNIRLYSKCKKKIILSAYSADAVVQTAVAYLLHPASGQILTKVSGKKENILHLSSLFQTCCFNWSFAIQFVRLSNHSFCD
jgi:hypothetical protein